MTNIESDEEIRKRIENRYKKRQELYINIASFVVANVVFWVMFHQSWVLWITFGWGIGVVAHAYEYYTKYGGGAERKEAAIQREIERERERLGYEKPKNDSHMRLTDDGELEEVPEDEGHWAENYKRNS